MLVVWQKKIRLSTRLAASNLIILLSETFKKKVNYLKFVKENIQEYFYLLK
jgi:hypothetical protein